MGLLDPPARPLYRDLLRTQGQSIGQAPVTTGLYAAASPFDTGTSDGTQIQQMGRMKVKVLADCTDLRIAFGNYQYGTDGANNIFVRFALETDQGNLGSSTDNYSHRASFNGEHEVGLEPGGFVLSDPIPIKLTKGDVIWLRTHVRVERLTETWPLGAYYDTGNEDQVLGGSADTTASVGFLSSTYVAASRRDFAPLAVLGTIRPGTPVIGAWGDSITAGMNQDAHTATFNRGWVAMAVNSQYPYLNLSRHTELARYMVPTDASWTPKAYKHKYRFAGPVTHCFSTYGVNDTGSTDTQAQIQANLLAVWTALSDRGIKVWAYTMPPRTTSSDSWATVGNQTVVTTNNVNDKRVAINDWVRDGAPILAGVAVATGSSAPGTLRTGAAGHPLKGYVETADAVESARNSGKWKAVYTNDGLHPIDVGHTAMAAAVTMATVIAS